MKKKIEPRLNLGVIVLCPDKDPKALKITVRSVANHCYDREVIAVVGTGLTVKEGKDFKDVCETYKCKNTITSLINTGMLKLKSEWGLIVYAGSVVKPFTERKLDTFAVSDKDIVFPLVDGKMDFVEGSSNGLLINKKTFLAVGDWPEVKEFQMAKLLWAIDANRFGCIFKAVIGLRIA